MSFASQQSGLSSANRVSLFLFEHGPGSGDYYAYTTSPQEVTFGGKTYSPRPIKHSKITQTGTADKAKLKVTLPLESGIAVHYREYLFARPVSLVIYKGHTDDPDSEYTPVWSGQVRACVEKKNGTAEIDLETTRTLLKSHGLRRLYQPGCAHVLYGPFCRAHKASATVTATVSQEAFYQNRILLPTGWNDHDTERYVGGVVSWENDAGTETQTILDIVNDDDLRISGVARGVLGKTVRISLGCRKNLEDCANLHVENVPVSGQYITPNTANFGGQPWIPFENPTGYKKNQFF